jgi:hypothetical protein
MGATRRRARRPLDGLARVPTWQLHHRADGRPETRAGNAETPREHVARGPENSYGSSPMSAPAQPRSVGGLRAIGRHGQLGALLVATLLLGNAASFVVPFMSLWGTGHVGMTSLGFGLFMTSTSLSSTVLSLAIARWSETGVTRRKVLLLAAARAFWATPVTPRSTSPGCSRCSAPLASVSPRRASRSCSRMRARELRPAE